MARGRKPDPTKEPLSAIFSIRIKSSHKDLMAKNPWIKKELEDYIRTHLEGFSF